MIIKKISRKFFVLMLSSVLSAIFTLNGFAATNSKGFAVYRQGNVPNPSGHAGLVYAKDVDAYNAVIHVIKGDDDNPNEDEYLIHITSLDYFKNSENERVFYGFYVPKTLKNFSDTDRANKLSSVISTACLLKAIKKNVLNYNTIFQVWYSSDKNGNGRVDVSDITSMRCDGLVEYCYEYHGFSVYGGDISQFNTSIRDNHCAPNITPKQQIKKHLQNCLGDIDGNGKVTSADSRLSLRYVSGLESFDGYQKFVSDVNGDGAVTSTDARLILRYSSGQETSFPADPFPS